MKRQNSVQKNTTKNSWGTNQGRIKSDGKNSEREDEEQVCSLTRGWDAGEGAQVALWQGWRSLGRGGVPDPDTLPLRHLRTITALITAAANVVQRLDLRSEGPHWWGLFILKVTRFSVSPCFIMGSEFSRGTLHSIDFTLVDYYSVLHSNALWFYT